MKEIQLPFDVGDSIYHVKDPFKEQHEVVDIVKGVGDQRDLVPRFILRSTITGELMPLIVSRLSLAPWRKI